MDSAVSFFTSLSADVIIVSVLVIAGTSLALWLGKKRSLTILLSFIWGYALYTSFPYYDRIAFADGVGPLIVNATIFAVFMTGLYFVLNNFVIAVFPEKMTRKVVEAGFMGFIFTGFTLATLHRVTPIEEHYDFISLFDFMFAGNSALFLWFILLLGGLLTVLRE